MSVELTLSWVKQGATFANADAAHESKNAGYPAELTTAIQTCWANMLANGVLLEPITLSWNQENFTLASRRIAISQEAFDAAITFDSSQTVQLSQDAGWTLE